jgi:precorrin-6Y C5,15-methyltransferase (decarboxylating)
VDSGIDRGTDQTAGSEKSTRRIVLSASTLQTLSNAQELLERMQFVNITFTQIQASRSHRIGSYDLIRAENPVFVITADF